MKNKSNEIRILEKYQDRNPLIAIATLMIIIIPNLIKGKVTEWNLPSINEVKVIISHPAQGDIFAYYKFLFLIIMTMILILIFLRDIIKGRIKSSLNLEKTLLAGMCVLVLLSTLFSEYKLISFVGLYNRYEGSLAYLCYLLIAYILSQVNYSAISLRKLALATAPFILLNVFISLMNFGGMDLLSYSSVKNLLVPEALRGAIESGSYVIATLNNANYLSGFAAMLTVFHVILTVFSDALKDKILFALLSSGSFILLLMGKSQSGSFTFFLFAIFLLLYLLTDEERRKRLPIFFIILAKFFMLFLLLSIKDAMIYKEFLFSLDNLALIAGFILISIILVLNFRIALKTSYSKIVVFVSIIMLLISIFIGITVTNNLGANYNIDLEMQKLSKDPFDFSEPHVGNLNGRDYIYIRTIELIAEKPFIGHGLDTIAYNFPQEDPTRIKGVGSWGLLIDKPHNFYLFLAHGAGIPFLIMLIILLIVVHKKISKFLMMTENNDVVMFKYVFATYVLVYAFLFQGIANDPVTGVSIFFWIFLGVLISKSNENLTKE